ncbi:DNA-binding transcriptional regulator, AcrR family [Microlunatus sagamiharensis]|uniref:DNA-binding transcriptional regulator, AcrR family n=1 Tax=Microlunatus sagamiharensis TaxID=546874 RepID=A0A1H2MRG6_9ACTN|nr:DNA-binding transcriptional regulator, AcrR family [Microlunatus sagamiharensis]
MRGPTAIINQTGDRVGRIVEIVQEPRRQPRAHERVRDADRSRKALLEAAQAQFAEHGFAGARVEAIAAKAGVNKQLIAYYFGGKRGLYDAVVERRQALVAELDATDTSLGELAGRYVRVFGDHPELERLFLRDTLDQDPDGVEFDPDVPEVAELRRRQQDGELAPSLDPAFVLLFLQAMTVAGTLFPAETKRLTGLDPRTPEFRRRSADQVRLIVDKLADQG